MTRSVLGLIGGSVLLESKVFPDAVREVVQTAHGSVVVHKAVSAAGQEVVFIQRHAADPAAPYTQPHLINYAGIAAALQQCGCTSVVAVNSVGTLHPLRLPLAAVLVPTDYWCPYNIRTGVTGMDSHVKPGYDEELRSHLIKVLTHNGVEFYSDGVYVNSHGPRFETPAEIKYMANWGDVVGMTGAHEATACGELKLKYACICMVDNLANGTGPFTTEDFFRQQKINRPVVERMIQALVNYSASATQSEVEHKTEAVDAIYHARWVICVEPEGVLEHHSVVVRDGLIVAVCPRSEAVKRYSAPIVEEFGEHVLMPGLINAHSHAPMVYFRGLADDMPLLEWLTTTVWPAEAKWLSPAFVRVATRHACAEMIRGGTTCFNDMYFFSDDVAEATAEAGMRARIGLIMIEFPSGYGSGVDDYFAKDRKLYEAWVHGSKPNKELISFTISPHAPYTVSDETFERVRDFAAELDLPIHLHLHETSDECHNSECGIDASSRHKSPKLCRPFKNLDELGIVSNRLIAVHMTDVTEDEMKICAAKGVSVVHCPQSNMKIACGFAKVAKMLEHGVNVCIGSDGAASNNSLDMLAEMKVAAVLAKGIRCDATAVPAAMAIRMCTLNAAKAMHLDHVCGSLQPGKAADMIAINLSSVECQPVYNVISHVVYVATRECVTDSWVAGKRLMRGRVLTTINEAEVLAVWTRAGKPVYMKGYVHDNHSWGVGCMVVQLQTAREYASKIAASLDSSKA